MGIEEVRAEYVGGIHTFALQLFFIYIREEW